MRSGNFADASWKAAFPRRSGSSNPGNNDGYPDGSGDEFWARLIWAFLIERQRVGVFVPGYATNAGETRSLRGLLERQSGFWANRAWREEEMRHPTNGFRCVLEGPDYPLPDRPPAGAPVGKPQRHGLSRYQFIAAKGLPWSEAELIPDGATGHLDHPAGGEWAVQTFGSLLDSAGQSLWLGGYGQSANTASDWYWVTSENWSTPDWPLGNAVEDRSKVPMHFAALSRSPEGTATGVVPPKVPGNAGFLVEWEDSDGRPALTATGPPPAAFVNSLGMTFLPVPVPTTLSVPMGTARKSGLRGVCGGSTGLVKFMRPPGPSGCGERAEDHPVVSISWYEARSFCEWLGRKEGRAYRLPHRPGMSPPLAISRQRGSSDLTRPGFQRCHFSVGRQSRWRRSGGGQFL
ncbi:MAG: SUMF1/EgtB/PvdO family nonheme iron enzyme [Verrucomicrobiales bacterium]